MSREAMKLALEVMQNQGDVSVDEWIAAEKSLQKALAEQPAQQEPVAWRTFDGEGGYEYRSYDMNEKYAQEWEQRNPKHKGWVEPLYTPPAPCPTCEALARTVMMDQTSHDTSPQPAQQEPAAKYYVDGGYVVYPKAQRPALALALADAEADNRKLKERIADLERAICSAKDMVAALNGMSDYETWCGLLSKLEKDLARV